MENKLRVNYYGQGEGPEFGTISGRAQHHEIDDGGNEIKNV